MGNSTPFEKYGFWCWQPLGGGDWKPSLFKWEIQHLLKSMGFEAGSGLGGVDELNYHRWALIIPAESHQRCWAEIHDPPGMPNFYGWRHGVGRNRFRSREALRRQAFRLGQWWARFDPSLKEKEGLFYLTQAAPRGREQVVCLSAVLQATFRALGTKRVGKMQRQIDVWGCLWHLQWGSGWFWRPQAKIRSKKVIKVWIFRILRRSCILCKWGARQAAEFRQEPRRSTTDLYRCFLRTGRPPKTANPRDSGLFCLLLLLERPFFPVQSTRSATGRGFPVDLFVWCRCFSRNGFRRAFSLSTSPSRILLMAVCRLSRLPSCSRLPSRSRWKSRKMANCHF